MATVFEFFGIRKQSDYTVIPQLGIKNSLSALQESSAQYFTIAQAAQAGDGNQLGVSLVKGFTLEENKLQFVRDCVAQFNEKSALLKSIDLKIIGGTLLGVIAGSLTFLPLVGSFLVPLSWIGWGAAVYFMNERGRVFTEYKESLTLLVAVCNWSLGGKLEDKHIDALTKNSVICSMMNALHPVLTEKQVKHLVADKIQDLFIKEIKDFEGSFIKVAPLSSEENRIALSKKGVEFNRCFYGFNKGGCVDFLDALASSLPDVYRALQYGWHQGVAWCQEKMGSSQKPA